MSICQNQIKRNFFEIPGWSQLLRPSDLDRRDHHRPGPDCCRHHQGFQPPNEHHHRRSRKRRLFR